MKYGFRTTPEEWGGVKPERLGVNQPMNPTPRSVLCAFICQRLVPIVYFACGRKWQLIIARRRNIHEAQDHKTKKALCGVAGLERPLARFKGPLTSRKPRRSPAFAWSISSLFRYAHARTHTRRVWCGVEPNGSENGKRRCVVCGKRM